MIDETLWEGLIPGDEIAPQAVVMVGDTDGAPVGQVMRSTRCKHETLFFKENRTIVACKCGLELPTAGVRMLVGGELLGLTVEDVARRLFNFDKRVVNPIIAAKEIDQAINCETALARAWERGARDTPETHTEHECRVDCFTAALYLSATPAIGCP